MLKITLSASKIKTAISCSWKYYSSYILHIPEKSNSGSDRGTIVHLILECLAHPRRKKLAKQIIKSGKLFSGKEKQGIKKLIYKHAHKLGIADDENIQLIHDFIISGLRHDFWGEERGKPVETYTEKDFNIENDDPQYKVRGFIDRLFIYDDGHALIRDYKTSKEAYKGEEASTLNKQACAYVLAVKKLFPHVKSLSVEFLFLKYDCNVESEWATGTYRGKETKRLYHNDGGKVTLNYSLDDAEIFEYELEEYQNYLENFTEQTAQKNFAARQDRPEDDSFAGPVSCGRAEFAGQLKKDGSVMWHCPFKHPLDYYYISKDGEFVKSCFLYERESLIHQYPLEEYHWEEKKYLGCPHFYPQSKS